MLLLDAGFIFFPYILALGPQFRCLNILFLLDRSFVVSC